MTRNITDDELEELKKLLLGDIDKTFSAAWTRQGLNFKPFPPYGLMQKKSGPCGVMAAVQAYIVFELMFGRYRIILDNERLRPSYNERRRALSSAITTILFQARSGDNAVLVRIYDERSVNKMVEFNMLGEGQIKLTTFSSQNELFEEISKCLKIFMNDGGAILFLYSLILTRGLDRIKNDMDFTDRSLIGEDSYCSQEIINLILVGMAVQNVFDGTKELDGGLVLKGILKKSKIGFLSLSDYQDNDQVGEFYKSPKYPIWVLNANLHYYVLFGTSKTVLETDEPFCLWYTDSLSSDGEVHLTIDPRTPQVKELKATIRCIHTKWPSASVKVEEIRRE